MPEGGTDDDQMLGMGGTDAAGNFAITLSRPLIRGEKVFAVDRQNSLIGPAVVVGAAAAAPVLDNFGMMALLLGLSALGIMKLWGART